VCVSGVTGLLLVVLARGSATIDVRVDGGAVQVRAPATVERALTAAGVRPRDGRLWSVMTRRILDAHYVRAVVRVGNRRMRLDARLSDGARIVVSDGQDAIEPLATRDVPIPYPDHDKVAHGLWSGGVDGETEETYGARSGETVADRVIRAPVAPVPLLDAVVTLSFDDGPDPRWTPPVLQILAQRGVRAVFCLVGRSALAFPDLVRAIRDAGHMLCDHTFHHPDLTKLSPDGITAELSNGTAAIRSAAGVTPTLFRPPYGAINLTVVAIAARLGLRAFLWSVDPRDYTRPGVDVITHRVLDSVGRRGVVLLHDGGGDRSQTIAALPGIIGALQDYGYVLTTSTSAVDMR